MNSICTIPALRQAIKASRLVLVTPKFGLTEAYVKISKREALNLISGIADDDTPKAMSMYTDSFGCTDGDTVYIG